MNYVQGGSRVRRGFSLFITSIILIALVAIPLHKLGWAQHLRTERFIAAHMTNSNGTLKTYLADAPNLSPDSASGHESLSEALGLWLQYAVEKQDRSLFEQNYTLLTKYFLSKEGLIYWKLSPSGAAHVTTNALVDDLRIIQALFAAEQLWGNAEWKAMANKIGGYIAAHLVKRSTLVDFYDSKYRNSPDTLTLSYLNVPVITKLSKQRILPDEITATIRQLSDRLPNDGVFWPKQYHTATLRFHYDNSVNLIDQLLISLQLLEIGRPSDGFYTFIKNEFTRSGVIYGSYDRSSRIANKRYESPAVYGLVILYSLQVNDTPFAAAVYKRMKHFQQQSGTYAGGYVSQHNTHIFDNLYPMLAELRLSQISPLAVLTTNLHPR